MRRWPRSAPRACWTRTIHGRCSISGGPRSALDKPAAALPAFRQAAASTREDATAARLLAWAVRAAIAADDRSAAACAPKRSRATRTSSAASRARHRWRARTPTRTPAKKRSRSWKPSRRARRCRAGARRSACRHADVQRLTNRRDFADSDEIAGVVLAAQHRRRPASFPPGPSRAPPAAAGWTVARGLRTPAASSAKRRTSPFRTRPARPPPTPAHAPAVPCRRESRRGTGGRSARRHSRQSRAEANARCPRKRPRPGRNAPARHPLVGEQAALVRRLAARARVRAARRRSPRVQVRHRGSA